MVKYKSKNKYRCLKHRYWVVQDIKSKDDFEYGDPVVIGSAKYLCQAFRIFEREVNNTSQLDGVDQTILIWDTKDRCTLVRRTWNGI